jgi:hypothetical protein
MPVFCKKKKNPPKYINIRFYFIKDYINIKEINLKYISIRKIIANIFIKLFPKPAFKLL